MRVLVTGGRDYGFMPWGVVQSTPAWYEAARQVQKERVQLIDALRSLDPAPTVIIHGASHGADELADAWADKNGIRTQRFKAEWYPNGRSGGLDKSAGPIRNQRMIDEGKPDLVVAFSGGRGTADMIRRAEAAGIKVVKPCEHVDASEEARKSDLLPVPKKGIA